MPRSTSRITGTPADDPLPQAREVEIRDLRRKPPPPGGAGQVGDERPLQSLRPGLPDDFRRVDFLPEEPEDHREGGGAAGIFFLGKKRDPCDDRRRAGPAASGDRTDPVPLRPRRRPRASSLREEDAARRAGRRAAREQAHSSARRRMRMEGALIASVTSLSSTATSPRWITRESRPSSRASNSLPRRSSRHPDSTAIPSRSPAASRSSSSVFVSTSGATR